MSGGFVNLGLEDEEVKGQGRCDLLTSSQSEFVFIEDDEGDFIHRTESCSTSSADCSLLDHVPV